MDSIARWKPQFKSALAASPSARGILSAERVLAHCRDAGHRWRDSFWSPSVTLLAFLLQVLDAAKTVRAAVADLIGELAAGGFVGELPSSDPSAFAQARRRVPEAVFAAVLREVTERVRALGGGNLWRGRRVILVDGTCVSIRAQN